MAHPSASGLRSRVPANESPGTGPQESFADQTPLLDEEAVLSKHQMMEEQTLEIELEHIEVEKREKERLHFRDGKRLIDYVIAYETPSNEDELDEEEKEKLSEKAEKRERFQRNLKQAGLEIEYEEEVTTKDDKTKTHFLKVHAPWELLIKTAEEMMMKMPIKESDITTKGWYEKNVGENIRDMIDRTNPFEIHDGTITKSRNFFMGYFKSDRLEIYVGHKNKDTFFSRTDRSRMVENICSHIQFGEEKYDVGIKKMIHEGNFTASYPLHPGPEECSEGEPPTNDRQRLRRDWARFGRWFKFQPYDAIKDYFGTEIGLYFSWLGFYTVMLIPAALFGLFVFLYGFINARDFQPVKDICNKSNERKFYMCSLCDDQCPYWSLVSSCYYYIAAHAFDNDSTVIFAIFMSVWATVFLEFWKRRQAVLAYRWHMMHFEDVEEQFRPEFVATAPTWREDPVTGKVVPHVPNMTKYQRFAGVGSAISFMIFLVVAAVIGVIAYRASVFAALVRSEESNVRRNAKIITSVTAALLNLVFINFLKFFYEKLAIWLTNWENPRTATDYKDSFTYKMFLFQFVNTYSSIFYIAFFKLNLVVGTPGNYRRLGGTGRLDGCGAAGCLLDLCIQLAIIMVGQQIIGNITETAIPGLMKWWKLRQARKETDDIPQWEEDYKLSPLPEHSLFWEYLEVVLQFGFVTMFVAAFPLAPLFALLNSAIEVRVDAVNYVCQFRRPIATRAQDIGAWTVPSLAHVLVIFVPPLIDGTELKYYPPSTFNYSTSPDHLNWTKPWDPAAVEGWTFNDHKGVHLTSDEIYRFVLMIVLFCFFFPLSRSNYANQRSYSLAMALHIFAGIWYAIDNIRKITHGLAHVTNLPILIIWCVDRLVSIYFYRRHDGHIVEKEVIGKDYVILYVKLDKDVKYTVGDVYYLLHQPKGSTGIAPQRSHPFTTFANMTKNSTWDIGFVISIMEDDDQLCLPWTHWLAYSTGDVTFRTWGPYRSSVSKLYHQLVSNVPSPSHYVLFATGSGCGYVLDVLSCLAHKTEARLRGNEIGEEKRIDIFYSVRCKALYHFLRKPIDELLEKIREKNVASINFRFYVTSPEEETSEENAAESQFQLIKGRIDFEKALKSTTKKSCCYFVGRPEIAETVEKICKKKGVTLVKDFTNGRGHKKDRHLLLKYLKISFWAIFFTIAFCVAANIVIDVRSIKHSLKT